MWKITYTNQTFIQKLYYIMMYPKIPDKDVQYPKIPDKDFQYPKIPDWIFLANIPDTRPEPEVFTNTRTRYTRKLKIPTRWALVRTHNLHTQSNLKYVRAIWWSVQLSIISFMFFSNIYILTGVFKFHAMKQWLPLFIYMFTLCVTSKLYLKPKQKFILI